MVNQLIFSSFYPLANPLLNIRYIPYIARCRTSFLIVISDFAVVYCGECVGIGYATVIYDRIYDMMI